MWPASRPADEIGNKIKNYIKEMSNLIDGGMGLAGEGTDGVDDTEEDDDDDENIEDLPSVPETDEESKQAARDDAIDEDGVEESKSPV